MGGTVSVCGDIKTKGNECFKAGRYAEAVQIYSQALDADPKVLAAPRGGSVPVRCALLAYRPCHSGALSPLTDVTASAEQDHTVHSNRSAARLKINQAGFAVTDALSCITLAPTWPKGYFRLGQALAMGGKHAAAADSFRKALALSPDDASVQAELDKAEKAITAAGGRSYVYTWGAVEASGRGDGGRAGVVNSTPKPLDGAVGRQIRDLACGLSHTVLPCPRPKAVGPRPDCAARITREACRCWSPRRARRSRGARTSSGSAARPVAAARPSLAQCSSAPYSACAAAPSRAAAGTRCAPSPVLRWTRGVEATVGGTVGTTVGRRGGGGRGTITRRRRARCTAGRERPPRADRARSAARRRGGQVVLSEGGRAFSWGMGASGQVLSAFITYHFARPK
jgi:hypothetical protein